MLPSYMANKPFALAQILKRRQKYKEEKTN
jgi:hypothetical protein